MKNLNVQENCIDDNVQYISSFYVTARHGAPTRLAVKDAISTIGHVLFFRIIILRNGFFKLAQVADLSRSAK